MSRETSLSNDTPYSEVVGRLDEILDTVKSKDASIERSLDLLEEALKLGLQAVEMVDLAQPCAQDLQDAPSEQ